MFYVGLAVLWGLGCAAVAARYPRSVHDAAGEGFRRALHAAVAQAKSAPERVAATNELLGDVEHQLEAEVATPKVAGWLAVAGVALALVMGALRQPSPSLALGLVGLVVGLIGAIGARRVGDRASQVERRKADDAVSSLLGELEDVENVLPSRGRRRRRRAL